MPISLNTCILVLILNIQRILVINAQACHIVNVVLISFQNSTKIRKTDSPEILKAASGRALEPSVCLFQNNIKCKTMIQNQTKKTPRCSSTVTKTTKMSFRRNSQILTMSFFFHGFAGSHKGHLINTSLSTSYFSVNYADTNNFKTRPK